MAREEKVKQVEELADRLARSNIAVLTDYRGLTVAEMNDLRSKLRQAGVEYRVAKNTLTRLAAERVGRTALIQDLQGPIAIAFGYDDPVTAAKAVAEYQRTSRVLAIKSALLGDRRLSAAEVSQLAELPSKDQLRAQLVGAIQGPMASLVGAINGLLSNVVYAIDQRAQQLQEAAAA